MKLTISPELAEVLKEACDNVASWAPQLRSIDPQRDSRDEFDRTELPQPPKAKQ